MINIVRISICNASVNVHNIIPNEHYCHGQMWGRMQSRAYIVKTISAADTAKPANHTSIVYE